MEQKIKHRHFVVVSYLEWLNWNARGFLRVSPQRVIWCHVEDGADAVSSSLHSAPDLEPADDAFLIAQITSPPRRLDGGMLSVPLDGAQFQALSERSHRLMSPTATRMNVDLVVADDSIQDIWTHWKDRYAVESCDAQARRIWTWAWGQKWPSDPQDPHGQLLLKTRQTLAEMTRQFTKDIRLYAYAETSAEPWLRMALTAEAGKLLPSGDKADWRLATQTYFASFMPSKQLAWSFFPEGNSAFAAALDTLPLDQSEMIELMSVAVGQHHALRLNIGRDPNPEAFETDLRNLTCLVSTDQSDMQRMIISSALLAFGRLLPGSAVVAFKAKTDLTAGWANRLLESCNGFAPLSDARGGDVSDLPSDAEPKSYTDAAFQERDAKALAGGTENTPLAGAVAKEPHIDVTASDTPDGSAAIQSDRSLVNDTPEVPKAKFPTEKTSRSRNVKTTGKKDDASAKKKS
jgi:hypothetical protein